METDLGHNKTSGVKILTGFKQNKKCYIAKYSQTFCDFDKTWDTKFNVDIISDNKIDIVNINTKILF